MSLETIRHFDCYGKIDDHLYGNHSICDSYSRNIIDRLFVQLGANDTLVDVASGDGSFERYIKNSLYIDQGTPKIIQFDLSMLGLSLSEGLRARSLAFQLPLASSSAQAIHFKDALVHIAPDDRPQLLREFYRILKPGGIAVIVSQSVFGNFFTYKNKADNKLYYQHIKNKRNFLRTAKRFATDEKITTYSSPYFYTNKKNTLIIAQREGFLIDTVSRWKPKSFEKEWHDESEPRFVLTLLKPQS